MQIISRWAWINAQAFWNRRREQSLIWVCSFWRVLTAISLSAVWLCCISLQVLQWKWRTPPILTIVTIGGFWALRWGEEAALFGDKNGGERWAEKAIQRAEQIWEQYYGMVNTSTAKREQICCFLFWGCAVFGEEHKGWKGIKGGGIRGCGMLEDGQTNQRCKARIKGQERKMSHCNSQLIYMQIKQLMGFHHTFTLSSWPSPNEFSVLQAVFTHRTVWLDRTHFA